MTGVVASSIQAGTYSRKDVSDKPKLIQWAEKEISNYASLMTGAYTRAEDALHGALAATYAAALDLLKHPDLMEMFLDDRRSGPVSKNPVKPIVRKLWKGVHTRDTLHRYSSCLAEAKRENVKPDGFIAWVKETTIKK